MIAKVLLGLSAVMVLTGCAAAAMPNQWTTPEIERERAACLGAGGIWAETQEAYVCRLRGQQTGGDR